MSTGSRELAEVVRALESLSVGVVLVDADDAIALVNRPAERLFNYDRAELIGQSIDILLPAGWWARYGPASTEPDAAHRGGTPHELFARRKDLAEVPIQITLSPMTVGSATFVAATVADVSDRRRVEHELRVLRDERLQFEALLGELAAEFVSLQPEQVDRALEDGLGRVVRMLDLDRGELFHLTEDGEFTKTHEWTRPGWASPASRVLTVHQFPWHIARLRAGELVAAPTLDDVPNAIDRASLLRLGTKSVITIPVTTGNRIAGALTLAAVRQPCAWTLDVVTRLSLVAQIFANTLARKRADDTRRQTIAGEAVLRQRLQEENAYLRRELGDRHIGSTLVGHSAVIRRLLEQVREAAGTNATVLLVGEPGTGKVEVAARLHELSARAPHPMIDVPCATLTAAHLERELAGDTSAFTPTPSAAPGRLALAEHSTLFLDEVADLRLDAQAILSKVLWGDAAQAAGPPRRPLDARVVAATSRNLMRCVSDGTFRDDLYFRLSGMPIRVPPLRDRLEDVPLLVWRYVDQFSEAYHKPIDTIDAPSMAALQGYRWPGNIRELRNVVERAMIVATSRHLRIPLPVDVRGDATLAAVEKEHIVAVLGACDWRIEGAQGAAARLGMTPRALKTRLQRLRIQRPPS